MAPNKPQSNYSKRPIKRIRLLKIGPRKTKSLFEEYFYGFAVSLCVIVTILGKAGGLSGYDAIVVGLWVGGFTWSAWVLRRYRKEQAGAGKSEESKQAVQAGQIKNHPLPPNMKPMIGPQWPVKAPQWTAKPAQTPAPPAQAPGVASDSKKPAFVYERPTLPDRKPKLPNNWPGRPDKKPKR